MTRHMNPRDALDYPRISDDFYIIWSGNEHLWPDARRETHYLTDKRDIMRGYALFSPLVERARVFTTYEDAEQFLAEMSALRPAPYGNVEITTVAELKLARGYASAPIEPPQEDQDIPSCGPDL